MSSGFVSAGTDEGPAQRDDAWLKAQEQIEAVRRRKPEEGKQEGGKSLYEVLQQNKAAKQEAFEESIRLKNQFRTLDDDEVEFLDSVLESTRAKEEAVRKETADQLEAFRLQREEIEKSLVGNAADSVDRTADASAADTESWALGGRKRRRGTEKDIIRGKIRRTSSATDENRPPDKSKGKPEPPSAAKGSEHSTGRALVPDKSRRPHEEAKSPVESVEVSPKQPPQSERPNVSAVMGLEGYSSDSD